jgi:hypothetical protein
MDKSDSIETPVIVKMMDVSTKYIPLHTAQALGMTEHQSLNAQLKNTVSHTPWASYGWIISCSAIAADELKQEHPELSALMTHCVGEGIDYLKLDCDAGDGLAAWPVFDWETQDQKIGAMKASLKLHGYDVEPRDPTYREEWKGSFMIRDTIDYDGYGIVGDDVNALIKEAHEHLLSAKDGQSPACPRCSTALFVGVADDDEAVKSADLLDVAGIKKYQCRNECCGGAAFWM